jgi:hypothetical protein
MVATRSLTASGLTLAKAAPLSDPHAAPRTQTTSIPAAARYWGTSIDVMTPPERLCEAPVGLPANLCGISRNQTAISTGAGMEETGL